MQLSVRLITASEVDIIVDYFCDASSEHLEILGVDPTRIPERSMFRKLLRNGLKQPLQKRASLLLGWYLENNPIGFSTADKIEFGVQAYMHLHLLDAEHRQRRIGTEFVRLSVKEYASMLKLKSVYCEPNAFNIAPNRTLQNAGFRYVKTHFTVPGPLNYHQPVTRWVASASGE